MSFADSELAGTSENALRLTWERGWVARSRRVIGRPFRSGTCTAEGRYFRYGVVEKDFTMLRHAGKEKDSEDLGDRADFKHGVSIERSSVSLIQPPVRNQAPALRRDNVGGSVANRPHYGFRSLIYLFRMPVNSCSGIKQKTSIL
jgi:hypothetical protein